MGIDVIGIDIGKMDKEPFEHYQKDLFKEDALDVIDDQSVDVVLTKSFFDGPSVIYGSSKLREILYPQIKRILKKEGSFWRLLVLG